MKYCLHERNLKLMKCIYIYFIMPLYGGRQSSTLPFPLWTKLNNYIIFIISFHCPFVVVPLHKRTQHRRSLSFNVCLITELNVFEEAMPLIWNTYCNVRPSLRGYLTANGHLNLDVLQNYLHKLSQVD